MFACCYILKAYERSSAKRPGRRASLQTIAIVAPLVAPVAWRFPREHNTRRGCEVCHTSALQSRPEVLTQCVFLLEMSLWSSKGGQTTRGGEGDQGNGARPGGGGRPGKGNRPCPTPPTGYQLSASAQMILSPRFRACAKIKSIPCRISSFHTPGEVCIAWPSVMVCAHMRTTFTPGSGQP